MASAVSPLTSGGWGIVSMWAREVGVDAGKIHVLHLLLEREGYSLDLMTPRVEAAKHEDAVGAITGVLTEAGWFDE